jgi:RNA polymerase sigma factor (sigma-70 family)
MEPAIAKESVFDEGYLRRLRAGDEDTAKHFYRYFRRSLRAQLWGKFGQQQQEDLVDEVMAAAIAKILRGEPRDATRSSAYIRGICSNLARSSMRPSAKMIDVPLDFDRMANPERNAEEKMIQSERAAATAKVLDALNARDREILLDLFYRELPRDEVCHKHGVTRDQLRLLLFRARQKFQECWSDAGHTLAMK